jgi:hypothetical protein
MHEPECTQNDGQVFVNDMKTEIINDDGLQPAKKRKCAEVDLDEGIVDVKIHFFALNPKYPQLLVTYAKEATGVKSKGVSQTL